MADVERLEHGVWLRQVTLADYAVRGALLAGEERTLVWDTLSRPADMAGFARLVGDRPLVIVYSHADWDHVWGTAGLPHRRARIIAHEEAGRRFGADVPAELAEKRAAEPGAWDEVLLIPPTESFGDRASVALGGMTLELHHLPGHTRDSIVGFVPERGLLLAGDTVETPCPVVPPDAPLAEWVARLERWAADERVRTVVPAHGRTGGRELLAETAAYLGQILAGHPVAPPAPLEPFYEETHRANAAWGTRGR